MQSGLFLEKNTHKWGFCLAGLLLFLLFPITLWWRPHSGSNQRSYSLSPKIIVHRLFSCLDFQKASRFKNRKSLFAKITQTNLGEAVIRDSKASHQSQVTVLQPERREERRSWVKRGKLSPAPGLGQKRMESMREAPHSASQTSLIYVSTLHLFCCDFSPVVAFATTLFYKEKALFLFKSTFKT